MTYPHVRIALDLIDFHCMDNNTGMYFKMPYSRKHLNIGMQFQSKFSVTNCFSYSIVSHFG